MNDVEESKEETIECILPKKQLPFTNDIARISSSYDIIISHISDLYQICTFLNKLFSATNLDVKVNVLIKNEFKLKNNKFMKKIKNDLYDENDKSILKLKDVGVKNHFLHQIVDLLANISRKNP